jgi:pimeloyl-ACP methyl ester carboxylesterase
VVSGLNADDDKRAYYALYIRSSVVGQLMSWFPLAISLEKYTVNRPVFFAAAFHDYISPALLGIAVIKHNCKNATIREFQDGHWLMMSSPREVNAALFSWIMDCI